MVTDGGRGIRDPVLHTYPRGRSSKPLFFKSLNSSGAVSLAWLGVFAAQTLPDVL